jgi:hypothetical protein
MRQDYKIAKVPIRKLLESAAPIPKEEIERRQSKISSMRRRQAFAGVRTRRYVEKTRLGKLLESVAPIPRRGIEAIEKGSH